jgi:hypothetical protein
LGVERLSDLWLRLALIGLVIWLAVRAVVAVWLGIRLQRAFSSHANR